MPGPDIDTSAAGKLFRHEVIRLLQREVLLDEDRTRLLLSWTNSGCSIRNVVTVPTTDDRALEALARYGLRNSVSLARLRWTPDSPTATYLARAGHEDERAETFDAMYSVARLPATSRIPAVPLVGRPSS